jgi:hypothetical protein
MAHTPIARRAGPCQDAPARIAGMTLAQPAIGAHDAGESSAASWGAEWSGGMTLLNNRSPRITVLRRKGLTVADVGGACRTVIGCGLTGGAADCDRLRRERLPKLTRSLRRSFDWSSV